MFGSHKSKAGVFVAATLITALAVPGTVLAGSKGSRNTAIALGAVTAYELLHHKPANALIAGAATAYAYSKYQKDERKDDRYNRYDRHNRKAWVNDLERNRQERDRYDRSNNSYRDGEQIGYDRQYTDRGGSSGYADRGHYDRSQGHAPYNERHSSRRDRYGD